MNRRNRTYRQTLVALGLAAGAALPVYAVSLSTMGPAQPLPEVDPAVEFAASGATTAGSATLIPVMAADVQARTINTVDAPAESGAVPVGKPIDDIQFVKQATENGRKEVLAARDALPQLKNPQLKQIAEMLANDHSNANERLSRLAEVKGWPVPGPSAAAAPPTGTASSDFDAKWTAEQIAGHERSVALYRAQAVGGEDKDLRKYAKETLPTIEKHLAQLRSLQK